MTIGLIILSFVGGYIAYPFTFGLFKTKIITPAEDKLKKVEDILSNDAHKVEEKLEQIKSIFKS